MYKFESIEPIHYESEIEEVISSIWDDIAESDTFIEDFDSSTFTYWIRATLDDQLIGYFVLDHWNNTTLEFHSCLLKEYRSEASDMYDYLFSWIYENLPQNYYKLVSFVPENRLNVVVFALRKNWKIEGYISDCHFYDNEVIGKYVLGTSIEEID